MSWARRCALAVWAPLALAALACSAGLAAAAAKPKTYCQYRHYNEVYGYCTELPPKEAEKDCAARASKKYGEPIECECTDDPDAVGDRCEPHPAPAPEPPTGQP